MCFFKILNESQDNDHNTTILTLSDANPRFFLKSLDF